MIQSEKHLLKGLSVNFYCFLTLYVNYFDFNVCRGMLSSHVLTKAAAVRVRVEAWDRRRERLAQSGFGE